MNDISNDFKHLADDLNDNTNPLTKLDDFFQYKYDSMKSVIENSQVQPAAMLGYLHNFAYIVRFLNNLYHTDTNFSYLSYDLTEAMWHGWTAESPQMQNMSKIVNMIEEKMAEIFALALVGAGYTLEKEDDFNTDEYSVSFPKIKIVDFPKDNVKEVN